jgi:hypothetical protein
MTLSCGAASSSSAVTCARAQDPGRGLRQRARGLSLGGACSTVQFRRSSSSPRRDWAGDKYLIAEQSLASLCGQRILLVRGVPTMTSGKVQQELTAAMKRGRAAAAVLRMLKAALHNRKIERAPSSTTPKRWRW